HGLGAAGEQGVAKAIDLIRKDFDVTMGLTGTVRVDEIDRRILA
ncbi:L-lactate dehydrogenase, partial [Mesorhizobium sp. M1C.F.Ca.ET.193.01.1.1]